jgi:HAD superfamily hydrolase (TIGR01509 family)
LPTGNTNRLFCIQWWTCLTAKKPFLSEDPIAIRLDESPVLVSMVLMNPAMPKKDYDALIFDCDGTLSDSMPVHYLAWRETMSRYGIAFTEQRFYSLAGVPTDKIIQLLSVEQGVTVDVQQAAMEKEQGFNDLLHLLHPVEPVIAVAKHFLNRLPLVVASGGFRHGISLQLNHLGCLDWFDSIVSAEDTTRHKPEPDVFLEAARRVSAPPDRCLVYEDSDLGIQAAKSAGMDFIDVREFHVPRMMTM